MLEPPERSVSLLVRESSGSSATSPFTVSPGGGPQQRQGSGSIQAVSTTHPYNTSRSRSSDMESLSLQSPSQQLSQLRQLHQALNSGPISSQLDACFKDADEWQFDSLRLEEASGGRPLSCIAFFLIKRSGLVSKFHLSEVELARFLTRIEEGYPDNPYHCRTHAADVLRELHVILHRGMVLPAIVAAKHVQIPAWREYSATGIHIFAIFKPGKENRSATLSVENAQHFSLTGVFGSKVTKALRGSASSRGPAVTTAGGQARRASSVVYNSEISIAVNNRDSTGSPSSSNMFCKRSVSISAPRDRPSRNTREAGSGESSERNSPSNSAAAAAAPPDWDDETQMLVLKLALKCSDLGHLTSRIDVHKKWVAKLEEEMFRQGDQEKVLQQPVSPLMDRTKGGVTKSQTGFFNIVAMPMYTMLLNLTRNFDHWSAVEAEAVGHH